MTWMPVSWDFPTTGTKVHIQVNEGGVDVQLEAAGDDVGRFANDSRSAANDVAEHSLLYVHAKVNGRNLGLEGRDERRHCCACCPPLAPQWDARSQRSRPPFFLMFVRGIQRCVHVTVGHCSAPYFGVSAAACPVEKTNCSPARRLYHPSRRPSN